MAYLVYTGGYTEPILQGTGEIVPGRCPGISCYLLTDGGNLELVSITGQCPNPSYLAVNGAGNRLYCIHELKQWNGVASSAVSSYSIEDSGSHLRHLGWQYTGGTDGCHISLAAEDRYLLAGNYSSGSCAVFPIASDGSLCPPSCFFQHSGGSIDPLRQEGPHVHHVTETPSGDGILAVDLGQDKIFHYQADWKNGWLIPHGYPAIEALPGQGPRHLCWGKDGKHLYVLTELSGEINVYALGEQGSMVLCQRISAGAEEAQEHSAAAIRLHPNGRFLYVSLRTTNTIGIFQVHENGRLTAMEHISCGGENPRDLVLSPCGKYLLTANQDTGNVAVFTLNEETGHPQWMSSAEAPSVTAAIFAERKEPA